MRYIIEVIMEIKPTKGNFPKMFTGNVTLLTSNLPSHKSGAKYKERALRLL